MAGLAVVIWRNQAVTISPFHRKADGAHRIVVRHSDGPATGPMARAGIPAKNQLILDGLGQHRFYGVLKLTGQHPFDKSPGIGTRRLVSVARASWRRYPAEAQQIENLLKIPGSVPDRPHAVAGEAHAARVRPGRLEHLAHFLVDGLIDGLQCVAESIPIGWIV